MNLLINLLIFSLPFGMLTRITLISNISFYLHDIIAFLIFIYILYKVFIRKEKIVPYSLFKSYALFFGISIFSLIINSAWLTLTSFLISFSYLLRFSIYLSMIFAFKFVNRKFLDSINTKLIISGFIFAIFGLIQYKFYPNLRNLYYLGWDEHLYRLFSTFFDPNFAGILFVLLILLVLSNLLMAASRKSLITNSTILLITLLALYLTYSRSAFISLVIGVIPLLVVIKKIKIIFPAIAILVIFFFVFSNSKIEGLNPLRIASSEARITSVKEAIFIFQKNPILGVGFNAYRYAQLKYGFRGEKQTLISNADAGTDNSYLFVLATTGIFGFILFINLLLNIYKLIPKNHLDAFSQAVIPSFFAVLVDSIFINTLFFPLVVSWLFILVGVMVNRKR